VGIAAPVWTPVVPEVSTGLALALAAVERVPRRLAEPEVRSTVARERSPGGVLRAALGWEVLRGGLRRCDTGAPARRSPASSSVDAARAGGVDVEAHGGPTPTSFAVSQVEQRFHPAASPP